MLRQFICGNFHDQEDNEEYYPWSNTSSPNSTPSPKRLSSSASSSPKRNKISNFCNRLKNKKNDNKNPYSSRGLDKFTILVADLEDKRLKIIERIGTTQDKSLIRFGYSNSKGNWVPIVTRLRNQQQKQPKLHIDDNDKIVEIKKPVISRKPEAGLSVSKREIIEVQSTNTTKLGPSTLASPEAAKIKKKSLLDKSKSSICKYYLGLVIVLILLFLVIYGRSFAIICMSVCWYLMPIVDKDLNSRMKKKNNYTSEKNMGIDGFPCSFKTKNILRSTTMDINNLSSS